MFLKPNIRKLYDHIYDIKPMSAFQKWLFKLNLKFKFFRDTYVFYERDLVQLQAIYEKINHTFKNNNSVCYMKNGKFIFKYKNKNDVDVYIEMTVDLKYITMNIKYDKYDVTCQLNNDYESISRLPKTKYNDLTIAELWYLKCNFILNNTLMILSDKYI